MLHRDVVLCVGQAALTVSCLCFFVAGALRRSHAEGQQPPNPKGWTSRSRRTSHMLRPLGRPCRESLGLFVLSPFVFRGSRRQWGVSPRTRVSGALAVEDNQPSRQLALLEPETTAGQPAPVSTKALEPETTAGQPAPVSAKVPRPVH